MAGIKKNSQMKQEYLAQPFSTLTSSTVFSHFEREDWEINFDLRGLVFADSKIHQNILQVDLQLVIQCTDV